MFHWDCSVKKHDLMVNNRFVWSVQRGLASLILSKVLDLRQSGDKIRVTEALIGSHDPNFVANYHSISKKLVVHINISMSRNNARKIIGSERWIV